MQKTVTVNRTFTYNVTVNRTRRVGQRGRLTERPHVKRDATNCREANHEEKHRRDQCERRRKMALGMNEPGVRHLAPRASESPHELQME